jgi:hypothetical protein
MKLSTVILTFLGFESKILTQLLLKPFHVITLEQRETQISKQTKYRYYVNYSYLDPANMG